MTNAPHDTAMSQPTGGKVKYSTERLCLVRAELQSMMTLSLKVAFSSDTHSFSRQQQANNIRQSGEACSCNHHSCKVFERVVFISKDFITEILLKTAELSASLYQKDVTIRQKYHINVTTKFLRSCKHQDITTASYIPINTNVIKLVVALMVILASHAITSLCFCE